MLVPELPKPDLLTPQSVPGGNLQTPVVGTQTPATTDGTSIVPGGTVTTSTTGSGTSTPSTAETGTPGGTDRSGTTHAGTPQGGTTTQGSDAPRRRLDRGADDRWAQRAGPHRCR